MLRFIEQARTAVCRVYLSPHVPEKEPDEPLYSAYSQQHSYVLFAKFRFRQKAVSFKDFLYSAAKDGNLFGAFVASARSGTVACPLKLSTLVMRLASHASCSRLPSDTAAERREVYMQPSANAVSMPSSAR